jgi:Tol biopolymer transport system component
MRRTLLIAGLTTILAGSAAGPAGATFPGANGPIAYRPVDGETGLGVPLLRARPDGSGVRAISDRPGFFSDWRADGRRIAFDFFEPDGDEQIATARPDGSDVRVITAGPGIHEVPSWSPDGKRIVFDYSPIADPNAPGFETRLWTMRADGSGARPLPMRRAGFDVEPKYSPDGRWIAFVRNRPPEQDREWRMAIMVVGAEGGRVRRLTRWADYPERPTPQTAAPEHPTWSPDGRWILFNTGPNGAIEAIRPSGRGRHAILAATPGFGGHKPWYSPDGRRILFVCEPQGTLPEPPPGHNDDICVMDADGTDIVNLTNTPHTWENWPSWGPAPAGR